MEQVFEDVMEGLAWGKRGSEQDAFEIQRRDDGSIVVDYRDDDVYFVVSIRQVRRDKPEPPLHPMPDRTFRSSTLLPRVVRASC